MDENWVPIRNRDNDYLIGRIEQKHRSFTGIKGVSEQDACIQDSQGFIADRTREHLGPTDLGIVRFRRLMLEAPAISPTASSRCRLEAGSLSGARGGTVAHSSRPLDEVMTARFGDPVGIVREEARQSRRGARHLVSRFRRSYHFAARTLRTSETKGH